MRISISAALVANLLLMRRLTGEGVLKLAAMDDVQLEHFVNLVGAPTPDDLGDGEAATLAIALPRGCVAIDEKKARRIAARDYDALRVYCSLDVFCCDIVADALGNRFIADSVASALALGRMRVPPGWRDYVRALAT